MGQRAQMSITPTDKSLIARNRSRFFFHLGLIDQTELLLGNGCFQIGRNHPFRFSSSFCQDSQWNILIASALFGCKHGGIRVFEQRLGIHSMRGPNADTRTEPKQNFMSREQERRFSDCIIASNASSYPCSGSRKNTNERIAINTGGIASMEHELSLLEPSGQQLQDSISNLVPQ